MSDASNNAAFQATDVANRMAELGQRYLARTVGDLDELRTQVSRIHEGDAATLKSIEMMAHRIRGSGAMFGFELLSDAAGEIEMLAADAKLGLQLDRSALQARFSALLRILAFVLSAARQ
jgi:chemotaxis protein histidine kinase CheA